MFIDAAVNVLCRGVFPSPVQWQLQHVRNRVSISSFKQWKDLLIFKRYDGHHVWNLPQLKPQEFGFRRIRRKPPFFKVRKLSFPKVTKSYTPSHPFNRTLQIEYNWQAYSALYHEFHDALREQLPGVTINAIAKGGDTKLKVSTENGYVIFDAATDRYSNVQDVIEHCYRNMLNH
ncbi:hypothetical protein, conserved [Babesia bigemina]|uniref:Uncharacterized protein n=1 Tax=Babesia bigemina TaxID=5866 RepID=A0A061D8F7_BABBI|nr:hypothetical protein, conserved [Babesia bigemina]CDR96257.1 hypothetical protein, conserved [Babesia bigemina]|eukprot:XP_012768443.1 hypothetical protein, conserved [Babesia bigemina]